MTLELVDLESSDRLQLPGLLYTPESPGKKAAIWLHGMGDTGIFYSPRRINALGAALTSKGISLLAFNNRGAHNRKSLRIVDETLPEEDRVYRGGTYYEKIADCVKDIDGAIAFLKKRGFSTFYLLGHSTGANKICVYSKRAKQNPFSRYVLAGPGDDSGLYHSGLGEKKFNQALNYAKRWVKAGQPLRVMPRYSGMYPFSAQAAADIMDPDGDYNTFPFYEYSQRRIGTKPLFDEYKTIDKPALVIFGEDDEYTATAGNAANALKIMKEVIPASVRAQSTFELIRNADHSFHDHEEAFAEKVASWLAK